MVQHRQAVWLKRRFSLKAEEQPKIEDFLYQIEGKLDDVHIISNFHHRKTLLGH